MNATHVQAARYIRLPLFEKITGYTQKAVRRKIEDGVWLEGREYKRAPDGHIIIDMQGYYEWVEKAVASKSVTAASA